MKIVYVDTDIDGHHEAYINRLVTGREQECVAILPEKINSLTCKQVVYRKVDMHSKKLNEFVRWAYEIHSYIKVEKPDIVHFLAGDIFYKFFGLCLGLFSKYKTVMTLHWVRPGKLQRMSLKMFCGKVDKVVVHSEYLLKELKELGIKNGVHIEYPQFKQLRDIDKATAQAYWRLQDGIPVILALGNTREDKGVDILIDALDKVKLPFQLLIAGKPEAFDEDYILHHTSKYTNNVKTVLRYLTDDEVETAIAAADIVALPYKTSFNGASGPLGEGVCRDKCIIGSNHGNLGHTIRENHLGYTFETENAEDLAKVLNEVLVKRFVPDEKFQIYKASLNPSLFVASYQKIYANFMK